jgi:hypothetical protein
MAKKKNRMNSGQKAKARAKLPQICAHCDATTNLTIDHKLARALGGDNQLANLQTLCVKCNRAKARQEAYLISAPHRLHFEQLAQLAHGSKYSYTLAIHPERLSNIKIICPAHGIFACTPTQHLAGAGCPQCEAAVRKAARQWRHLNHLAWQKRIATE